MRKPYLFCTLALVSLVAIAFSGCNKRFNGIDNDDEIQTPYSLYYSDSAGTLYNTNNGDVTRKLVFPADGYPSRSLVVSGPKELVWLKRNAHVSLNNGDNWGPTYLKVNPASHDQSAMIYARDQERVYLTSYEGRGVAFNEHHGEPDMWELDPNTQWEGNDSIVNPILISSFTQLQNGHIIAYDVTHWRIFSKADKGAKWVEKKIDTMVFKPWAGYLSLSHFKNTVIAIDSTDSIGVWYSNDEGSSWTQFQGIPPQTRIACAGQPFEEELLVGTYYLGLWRLENGILKPASEGLDANTIVRSIKGKLERYKNDVEKRVVYIATSTGLYRSEDIGRNWVKVRDGNYVNVY